MLTRWRYDQFGSGGREYTKLKFIVRDLSSPAFLGGATITFTSPENLSQVTGDWGETTFTLSKTGWYYYSISTPGYKTYSAAIDIVQGIDLVQTRYLEVDLITPPPQPDIPGGLAFCTLVEYDSSFGLLYGYDYPDGSMGGRGWFSRYDAVYHGSQDGKCKIPAPPPPAPISWQSINDAIAKASGDISRTFTGSLAPIQAALDGIPVMISTTITNALQPVTEAISGLAGKIEQEATAWRAGILDLDGRIKAWIADSILELLMKKLMEGRKLDNRR